MVSFYSILISVCTASYYIVACPRDETHKLSASDEHRSLQGGSSSTAFNRCGTPDLLLSKKEQKILRNKIAAVEKKDVGGGGGQSTITINVKVRVVTSGGFGDVSDTAIAQQIQVLNNAFGGIFLFALSDTTRIDNADYFSGCLDGAFKATIRDPDDGPDVLYFYTCLPDEGYATYPVWYDANPLVDGVVVRYDTLPGGALAPYNLGQTGTHEVGHWMGLLHTFQGGCDGGDYIDDTPAHDEPNRGCPTVAPDSCPAPGADPINNFMNLSDDICMTEFTADQQARMQSMWEIYRSGTFTSVNPPIQVMASVPLSGQGLVAGNWQTYVVENVPPVSSVSVVLSGPNGDADLFLGLCSSIAGDSADESCTTFYLTVAESVEFEVYASATFTGLTITATVNQVLPVIELEVEDVTYTGISLLTDEFVLFSMRDLPAGATVTATTSGNNGDADLSFYSVAETEVCGSEGPDSNEVCAFTASTSTNLVIQILASTSFTALALTIDVNLPPPVPQPVPQPVPVPTQPTNVVNCNVGPGSIEEYLQTQGINVGGAEQTIHKCLQVGSPHQQRCFDVFIPPMATGEVPLVMDIHGSNSCPGHMVELSGWAQKAVENQFVVVWPLGVTDPNLASETCFSAPGGQTVDDMSSFFTTVGCCCEAPAATTMDLEFLERTIDLVVNEIKALRHQEVTIDESRIYMAGHSNGCVMSLAMAATYPDRIAAVGCHAGSMTTPISVNYTPVPVMMIFGEDDFIDLEVGLPPELASPLFTFSTFGSRNLCSQRAPDEIDIHHQDVTIRRWTDCQEGADVVLLSIKHVGHSPYLGVEGLEVDTTQKAWEFCSAHTQPVAQPVAQPVPQPVPTPPPPPSCLSGYTIVQTKTSFGEVVNVPISDVNIGDQVLTKSGTFQSVYAWAHFSSSEPTSYISVQFNDARLQSLEITAEHLVYLKNKKGPVRAASLKPGDVLLGSPDMNNTISSIKVVQRDGFYGPLTPDGTIVVANGIVASSYSAVQQTGKENVELDGVTLPVAQDTVIHLFFTPLRLFCLQMTANLDFCTTEDGMFNPWAKFGLDILAFVGKQVLPVQVGLYGCVVVMMAPFVLIEFAIKNKSLLAAAGLSIVMIARYWWRGNKSI